MSVMIDPDSEPALAAELNRLKDELARRLIQRQPRQHIVEVEDRIRATWSAMEGGSDAADRDALLAPAVPIPVRDAG